MQHRGSASDSRGSVLEDERRGGQWLKIQVLPHILLRRGWPARSSSLVFIFLGQRHQVTPGRASFVSSKKKPLVAEFTVRVRALQVFPAVQKGKPWAEKEFQELPAVEDPHTSPVVVTKLQGSAAPEPRVPQSEWPVLLGKR